MTRRKSSAHLCAFASLRENRLARVACVAGVSNARNVSRKVAKIAKKARETMLEIPLVADTGAGPNWRDAK